MSEKTTVALITDAASFIGPAVLETFSRRGVKVLAADPSFQNPAIASAIQARYPNAIAVAQGTPAQTVALARSRIDEIDILCTGGVLAAAKTVASSLNEETTRPFFEKLAIEPLAYASLLVDGMKSRRRGRIVFVTSAGPIGGIPNYTAYAAARSALSGAVKSLAMELGSYGISVNAVAPNFIATEAYFPKALIDNAEARAKILSRVPVRRFGEPMEAAATVEFFALADAAFVTGQVISVSGGWS
jgi:NAD(P)-dependent dehydrogenase (short-subunit alcohol dehydrogenase family)